MTKKQLLIGSGTVLLTIVISFLLYFSIIFAGSYAIDEKRLVMDATSTIVDEQGQAVTQVYVENRKIVSNNEIPVHVQEAFVAIEDARFYQHQGIDFRSIARALYRDILAGAKVQGASTITQQLAKNTFLSHDKTFFRKTKEVLIAMNLERQYSKDKILEMYLNRIYFGHGAYGIEAASKLYFNKSTSELTVDEGALLAGLPKAPNQYSPINNIDKSIARRNLVLNVIQKEGYLDAEETVRLQGKVVHVANNRSVNNDAYTTYVDMIIEEAKERYGLSNEEVLRGGYTIVTPINTAMQEASFRAFQESKYYPKENEDAQVAFVLMDVDTGGVLAVQGGRDYVAKGINRVNIKRQPGSIIKPLAVYGPALEEGLFHPYSMLKDKLVDYNGYIPRNYNRQYNGEMTMYDAITQSANAPAVWALQELGVEKAKEYLAKANIDIPDVGLAIALGGLTEGVTPLEITKAYRPFASDGKYMDHHFITEIYDRNGKLIGQAQKEPKQIYSPQTAWYMTRMLESVVKEGTGARGFSDQALAGKTGTTSYTEVEGGARDAWFVGYTSSVVGSIWMGYDQTNTEKHLHGGSAYPTVMFKEILEKLPTGMKHAAFYKSVNVDELEPPLRLIDIKDVKASITFGGKGLFGAKLSWTPSSDNRLAYNIYEVKNNEMNYIGTVQGVGEFRVGPINLFSRHHYVVVPYNELTEREGEPSNIAPVEFKLGF